MKTTYWQKQEGRPLFPELEWNKPERRDQAGKLLIIGGSIHTLTAPLRAFEYAKQAGIGDVKVVLPDKTKRLLERSLPEAVFLPSTPSGEFAQEAAPEFFDYAAWANTLLLPGDNGRNSQTTILFEELLQGFAGHTVLTRDALESLGNHPAVLFERPLTTVVASFSQLQKLIQMFSYPRSLTFSMDLVQLVDLLHELTKTYPVEIMTSHHNQYIAAVNGLVSTTKCPNQPAQPQPWRLNAATAAACYRTWNPLHPFEALSAASYSLVV